MTLYRGYDSLVFEGRREPIEARVHARELTQLSPADAALNQCSRATISQALFRERRRSEGRSAPMTART